MKACLPYYSWFHGHGRAVRADLSAEDPFGLAPGGIVDRIVAAGYTPAVERPQSEPFRSFGTVTEVEREGLVYLVAASRDAEEIGVQERRDEAYEVVEYGPRRSRRSAHAWTTYRPPCEGPVFQRGNKGRYPERSHRSWTTEAIVSAYRLELGKVGSASSKTPPFSAASDAVRYLEMWEGSGGVAVTILRDGKPIDQATLRKDVEAEGKRQAK